LGAMAVVTFFLLSGFLSDFYGNEERPIKYILKRFLRLYPGFIIGLILTSTFSFLFLKDAFVGWFDILLNFTMLPGLFGANPVDGVYWTLQYEIIFYGIILIFISLKK
jgi:peptidoglycan/LPS O-acetylase OafA/YrhL